MSFFKASFFISMNLLSMSSLIICSSKGEIVRARKQTFETLKITNPLILHIKTNKDWSDSIKIHLLEHLAWKPKLFLENAQIISGFKLQLQHALQSFGKKLPQSYNGKGSLPKFSDSSIILPAIESESLKKAIDILCSELKVVKIKSLDRKIEILQGNMQKLNASIASVEKISIISKISHESSIKTHINKLLGLVDEKRQYVKDVQVLEKDIENLVEWQKLILFEDESVKKAIMHTIEAHQQYRDSLLKEAEKALIVVKKEKAAVIPHEIIQNASTIAIMVAHTELDSNFKKLSQKNRQSDSIASEDKRIKGEQLKKICVEDKELDIPPYLELPITEEADDELGSTSINTNPAVLISTEPIRSYGESDISPQNPDQAAEEVAPILEEAKEFKNLTPQPIEEKKVKSKVSQSFQPITSLSTPLINPDPKVSDAAQKVNEQKKESKSQDFQKPKEESSFLARMWSRFMSLLDAIASYLTTPLI